MYKYQYDISHVRNQGAKWGSFRSMSVSRVRSPEWTLFFCVPFFSPLFWLGTVCFHNGEPLGPYVEVHILYWTTHIPDIYLCIQSAAAAAAVAAALYVAILLLLLLHLMLLAPCCCCLSLRAGWQVFVAGSMNLILVFFSLHSTPSVFNVPLGCTLAFTASIWIILHIRWLLAFAEPRRAPARHGKTTHCVYS